MINKYSTKGWGFDAFLVILEEGGKKSERKKVCPLEIWVVDVKIFLLLVSAGTQG